MWPFQWTPSSSPQSQLHVTAAITVACRSRLHQQILHLVEHPGPSMAILNSLAAYLPCTDIPASPPQKRQMPLSPASPPHERY